jgi:hypothetical protein
MEKNPAKAFLSRYRALKFKCDAIDRAIKEALADATNTTVTLKQVQVQTSGSGERMADDVIRVIDATADLERQRLDASRVLSEILTAIRAVPDEMQQTVLIEKYVNGRTLIDIQKDIHYERRNTQIIHGRALWSVWQYMKKAGLCEYEK